MLLFLIIAVLFKLIITVSSGATTFLSSLLPFIIAGQSLTSLALLLISTFLPVVSLFTEVTTFIFVFGLIFIGSVLIFMLFPSSFVSKLLIVFFWPLIAVSQLRLNPKLAFVLIFITLRQPVAQFPPF